MSKTLRQAKLARLFPSCGADARSRCSAENVRVKPQPLETRGEKEVGLDNKTSTQTESANAWKKLLKGPRQPPVCKKHGEKTVLREVKKEGPNKGRRFFVCNRPEGLPNNPKSRCNYFEWY
uniref:GRF-type domain-containing protein n=1 Tax=Rhodosorus marinus TaxID=101924 RepID=A0A7S0BQ13_9RHOD|mmetsp:Transcript_3330/g.4785  ORF Transcript_3330/g.4785 Transcript_3330/m.4785 type:complete len:121 (+) Transcript_3330:350-712(+)